jgi:redox-sensitive bicupin YhaK (pirin superfamily)
MIKLIPYQSLGHVNHGWLDARHHFSFGNYYDPKRLGFGNLIVINDDLIKANKGFPPHPHRDMEIITYVRKGAISHKDSEGNEGKTKAGDVQIMSAGSGITHSEYNFEDEETSLYQIWILPDKQGIKPRWQTKSFPKELVKDKLNLLVGNSSDAPLFINQKAEIYAGRLPEGLQIKHQISKQSYILLSEGEVKINGQLMQKGDGAEIADEKILEIEALQTSEILIINLDS